MEDCATVDHGPPAAEEISGMVQSSAITETLTAHQQSETARGESLPQSRIATISAEAGVSQTNGLTAKFIF